MFGIPDTSNLGLLDKNEIKVSQKVRYGTSIAEGWIEINFGCKIMNLTASPQDLEDIGNSRMRLLSYTVGDPKIRIEF